MIQKIKNFFKKNDAKADEKKDEDSEDYAPG